MLREELLKPYPLGVDNPYRIMQEIGSTNWSVWRLKPFQKVATFKSQFEAYEARRALLKSEGYNS
jgi:hypothetical protein